MTVAERVLSADTAESWIREALTMEPGGVELTVSGTCMEPALTEGARVQLKLLTGRPTAGDVLLLRTALGLRLHRVVFRYGTWLRTKGDRGVFLDAPVSVAEVLAQATFNESPVERIGRTGLSLLALFLRPLAMRRSDRAHAQVLPSSDALKYAPPKLSTGRSGPLSSL